MFSHFFIAFKYTTYLLVLLTYVILYSRNQIVFVNFFVEYAFCIVITTYVRIQLLDYYSCRMIAYNGNTFYTGYQCNYLNTSVYIHLYLFKIYIDNIHVNFICSLIEHIIIYLRISRLKTSIRLNLILMYLHRFIINYNRSR